MFVDIVRRVDAVIFSWRWQEFYEPQARVGADSKGNKIVPVTEEIKSWVLPEFYTVSCYERLPH